MIINRHKNTNLVFFRHEHDFFHSILDSGQEQEVEDNFSRSSQKKSSHWSPANTFLHKMDSVAKTWRYKSGCKFLSIHPLNLFHLKLSQTSIILSSCAREKVLSYYFKFDLYFGKTFYSRIVWTYEILYKSYLFTSRVWVWQWVIMLSAIYRLFIQPPHTPLSFQIDGTIFHQYIPSTKTIFHQYIPSTKTIFHQHIPSTKTIFHQYIPSTKTSTYARATILRSLH